MARPRPGRWRRGEGSCSTTPPACSTPTTSSASTTCAWPAGGCGRRSRSSSRASRRRPTGARSRDLKELADGLGERRDRDVAIAALEEFSAKMPAPGRPGVDGMVARLRTEQAEANERPRASRRGREARLARRPAREARRGGATREAGRESQEGQEAGSGRDARRQRRADRAHQAARAGRPLRDRAGSGGGHGAARPADRGQAPALRARADRVLPRPSRRHRAAACPGAPGHPRRDARLRRDAAARPRARRLAARRRRRGRPGAGRPDGGPRPAACRSTRRTGPTTTASRCWPSTSPLAGD